MLFGLFTMKIDRTSPNGKGYIALA